MSKLNTKTIKSATSPLTSTVVPGAVTHGGGKGAVSDSKTELFRLGVNLFAGGEKTYYESGKSRDDRFTKLVEKVAIEDPTWTVNFLIWLRGTANIRTASIIGAAHFVHARLANKDSVAEDELLSSVTVDGEGFKGLNRYIICQVIMRADEPGEFVSYWLKTFGKLPKPVKRGIADSVQIQYNEYTTLKYNTSSHDVRFSDVLNLTHAKPLVSKKILPDGESSFAYEYNMGDLFKYIIDKRYDNTPSSDGESLMLPTGLPMISANTVLRRDASKDASVLLDSAKVKAAGMTWEDVLSLGGANLDKAKLWESVIPSMGIMALIRNLRNFEEANISKASRDAVIARLTDPKVIARSRQFPFRFLSAFQNTNSLQYHAALETALEYSCKNIPVFDDGTLVLIDTSGSMSATISNKSKMTRAGAAALFAAAVHAKSAGNVDVVMFGSSSKVLPIKTGTSVLSIVKEVERRNDEVGSGTETYAALTKHFDFKKHKRVFIFSDLQSFGGSTYYHHYGNVADFNFGTAFVYAFDLAGYQATDMATGKDRKFQLGGLTDSTFKLIPMLEQLGDGVWPWEL